MPLSAGGRLLTAIAVAVLLTSAAVGGWAVVHRGRADLATNSQRPPTTSRLEGPPLRPATLFAGQRRQVTCPTGSEPTVDIESASFRPPLVGGTRLARGPYRITLRGSVVNETNSPVVVHGVGLSVTGEPWHAAVARPDRLGAGEAQPLVVHGVFQSRRRAQARVAAALSWDWEHRSLRRCGTNGLIHDD